MSREEGNLSEITLPEIIRDIYMNRWTGILHFNQGEVKKQILFGRGNVISCRSNVPEERVGEILVRRGKISPEVRDSAVSTTAGGRKIGTILVEMGVLAPQELVDALMEQAVAILAPVFAWPNGTFQFEEAQELETETGLYHPTANILMEAVRRIEDFDVIVRGLKDFTMTVVLSANPLLRFQSISLRPKEGFILSRIDGFLTISEICSISAVPEEDTLRCLYGLLAAGILELQPGGSRPTGTSMDGQMDGNIAGFFLDLAGTEEYLEQQQARVDVDDILSDEERKQEEELEMLFHQITAMSHYEVLGVPKDADSVVVKKAYYKLAKRYHPDRFRGSIRKRMQVKIEKIFIKINEAYECLSNDKARMSYDSRQQEIMRPAESQQEFQEELKKKQEVVAEQNFRQAKQMYEQGDFHGAIQLFKRAWHYNPTKPAYAHHLAVALSKNPKWQKQAEEFFLKAIELDPFAAENYAQLGKLYQRVGLKARAEKRFQEALKWDAGNKTALDGLQELDGSKNQGIGQNLRALFMEKKKK